ncbi:MAG: tetratricopeptide repeat protein [Deltaproteobacteria bacterium]|nr:tetratricopeptide repeat protein [Deltaproteobacteria bacterium]
MIPRDRLVFPGQDTSSSWADSWREARKLASDGHFAEALKLYELFLQRNKDVMQANWEQASILLSRREFDRAAVLLEMLLEETPDRVEYLNALGYAMQAKGHFDRSVELFERAIKIEPENLVAVFGLGEGFLALGRLDRALPYLENLLARQTADVVLQEKIANVYEKLHHLDKARPFAAELANRKHASMDNLKTAARIHEELGLADLAEHYWLRVLDKSADDGQARAWLASRLEKEGRCAEALPHLLFLLQVDESKPELLARTGNCYLKIQEPAKAIPYYEKFLEYFPKDKDIMRQLVNINVALGNDREILAVLDRYFQVETDPSPENLRRAARLYDAAGRYQDAIAVYQRLLKRNPDDLETLATLAQDLLAIGDNDGALRVWAHLVTISPDRKAVYHSMLELLTRLGRQEELHGVLVELHKLDPEDKKITLRLAASFFAKGEMKNGEAVLREVAETELSSPDLLLARASLFEQLQMADHALRDYEEVLQNHQAGIDLHFKCLRLAGSLGKLTLARKHLAALQGNSLSVRERLLAANAFRDGCDYETASVLYQGIVAEQSLASELRRQTAIELAALYERQGLIYEAEQVLRVALLDATEQEEVKARLVELQLDAGRLDEADRWLTQLHPGDFTPKQDNSANEDRKWLAALMSVKHLNAGGKYAAAVREGRGFLTEVNKQEYVKGKDRDVSIADLLSYELATAFLAMEEFGEAEKLCLSLRDREVAGLPALVLLKKIQASQGNMDAASETDKLIMAEAGKDLGRMLILAQIYLKDGNREAMVKAAREARAMDADSFSAAFWLATAHSASGRLGQARALVNALEGAYPENLALESLAARVAFGLGLNEEALAHCDAVLSHHPERADMELLRARIYWRKLDWQEALKVYQGYLAPAVGDLFLEQSTTAGLQLPEEPKPSAWQRLTFTQPAKGRFIDEIMSPFFVATPENADINRVAIPLYARYMWQQRFAEEMTARRLVEQRDDFQAVNQLALLVDKYPEDESLLFDLAGIYSRLGNLGEEAQIYERLARTDPEYPGLAESLERNSLKRMPRANLSYRYRKEVGRNGYKAIRSDAADIGSWTSIKPGHDVDVSLSRIKYADIESDENVMSKRTMVAYDASIFNRLDVRLGGGVESFDSGVDSTALIECDVTGKVGDRIQGEFRYVRDVVSDTLASLTRNIAADNLKAGLFLGILPRLITGGDYDYTIYSDGNDSKAYSVWASYILFPEPTSLELKFNYEFRHSQENGAIEGSLLEDGFSRDDHPYWAPSNYWKNSYLVTWKHKLSADTLERGTPSYYSTSLILDYDSQGHVLQTVKGGFFFELTKNFMLESAVEFVSSDEYRARDFILSAIYRW